MAEMTDSTGTITFDTSSGISLEEQQEILSGINAMAGGSRLVQEAVVTKAKKKGFLFPVLVNSGAIVILALGFILLSRFHGQDEQEIRESSAGMGFTERALIEEIRKERSPATEELSRLWDERERNTRIESQMGGFFSVVDKQIEEGKLGEAAATLNAMRDFLASPSIRGIRSMDTLRQNYLASINSLETAVSEILRLKEAAGGGIVTSEALAEMRVKYSELEQNLASMSSGSSDQAKIIADYTAQNRELTERNINQQETLNRRDSEIVSLRTEKTERENQLAELNTTLAEQRNANAALSTQNEELTREIERYREAARALLEN